MPPYETIHRSDRSARRYRCPASVVWAVEKDGIFLMNKAGAITCSLGYPEAAVWDLLVRGYPFKRIISLLSSIHSLEPEAAERVVRNSIDRWVREGYLQKAGEHV